MLIQLVIARVGPLDVGDDAAVLRREAILYMPQRDVIRLFGRSPGKPRAHEDATTAARRAEQEQREALDGGWGFVGTFGTGAKGRIERVAEDDRVPACVQWDRRVERLGHVMAGGQGGERVAMKGTPADAGSVTAPAVAVMPRRMAARAQTTEPLSM